MTRLTFKEAFEKNLKNFIVYSLSFTSAQLLTRAIIHSSDKRIGGYWKTFFIITIMTLIVLTIISVLDPSDIEKT